MPAISRHGLDDLHPRRGDHAAEHDVDEHERAGDQDRGREVDAHQRLDQHARADHLRDQVEGGDVERADRRRDARGALAQAEGQHVGDRVLARVPHPLGEQEHHGQERDEEADRVDEAVEAEQVDQAGDAEERRGRQVVAGDREAVLEAGDAAPGGVEADGAGGALGRPVGDAERDREDDREDDDRRGVDLCEDDVIARPPRGRGGGSAADRVAVAVAVGRSAAVAVPGVALDRLLGERVEDLLGLAAGTSGRARAPSRTA